MDGRDVELFGEILFDTVRPVGEDAGRLVDYHVVAVLKQDVGLCGGYRERSGCRVREFDAVACTERVARHPDAFAIYENGAGIYALLGLVTGEVKSLGEEVLEKYSVLTVADNKFSCFH